MSELPNLGGKPKTCSWWFTERHMQTFMWTRDYLYFILSEFWCRNVEDCYYWNLTKTMWGKLMNNCTEWNISGFLPEACSSIITAVPGKCFSNPTTKKIWRVPKCLKRNISELHDAKSPIPQQIVDSCFRVPYTWKDFVVVVLFSKLPFSLTTKLWCIQLSQS